MDRMRIACPSCGTEYEVPTRLLAGGVGSLRCSRCATDFPLPQAMPAAAEATAAAPPTALVAPPKPESALPPPVPHERAPVASALADQAALVRAWAASLAVVVVGVLALLVFRTQLMASWPPVTRLFAVLGLA